MADSAFTIAFIPMTPNYQRRKRNGTKSRLKSMETVSEFLVGTEAIIQRPG
ncbi:MAG: hypothetical protein AAFN70_21670 [Planctomycetota bacterium]